MPLPRLHRALAALLGGLLLAGAAGAATPKPAEMLSLDAFALYMGEVTVVASYSAGPGDMREALRLIAAGEVDPMPLVTHRLGLEDTARALELQRTGEAVKALVLPG